MSVSAEVKKFLNEFDVKKYNKKKHDVSSFRYFLSQIFDEDDIIAPYQAFGHTFSAFIKSRDMIIDHFEDKNLYHWYESGRDVDKKIIKKMKKRKDSSDIIRQWTESDVSKREKLLENDSNYVAFWDTALEDMKLWYAFGMPDGKDFLREYSWLPLMDISNDKSWPEALTDGRTAASAIAKKANFEEFYKHCIRAIKDNDYFDNKWGTVQARLYANRFKYYNSGTLKVKNRYYNGRLPGEYSSIELLRGLVISGAVRGYSSFDNSLMKEFLYVYSPEEIYDFCMGWGERLVTCASEGVKYTGLDINVPVVRGAEKIIDKYNIKNAEVFCGSSDEFDMTNSEHDCVFTCPPYQAVEIFSDKGAENLDEDAFREWFKKSCEMAMGPKVKYFAIQTNQKCKPLFESVMREVGMEKFDEFMMDMQISHIHRKSDGSTTKKEFESLIVFITDNHERKGEKYGKTIL